MASDLYTDLALSWHLPLSLLERRFCWLLLIFYPTRDLPVVHSQMSVVCLLELLSPGNKGGWCPTSQEWVSAPRITLAESQGLVKSFWWSLEYSGPQGPVWREILVLGLCLVTALR